MVHSHRPLRRSFHYRVMDCLQDKRGSDTIIIRSIKRSRSVFDDSHLELIPACRLGVGLITEKGSTTPKSVFGAPKPRVQHTVLRGNLRSLVSLVGGLATPRPICCVG